jgi:endoglycosylceramidase
MRNLLPLLLPVVLLAGCDRLEERAGRLYDPWGREVLYRGVNARALGIFDVTFDDGRHPVETVPPFGDEDCRFLAEDLGLNLLRLPVSWSGVEPRRGEYDRAYLQRVVQLVDTCYARGVSTLVDFHQDAWSKEIGQDGAPLWAIVPPPTELLEGPITNLDERRFSTQALDAALSFFENAEGLQDAFATMAQEMARALEGHPGAIGLELMNEPLLGPGQAQDLYGPIDAFHRKVGAAVRTVAPELTIFYEPNSVRNLFDRVPVIPNFPLNDVVYSPHIYTGVFSPAAPDLANLRKSVQAAKVEAASVGGALFVGEFGQDLRFANQREYVRNAMQAFDESLASWAFWVYEEIPPAVWGLWDTSKDLSSRTLRPDAADVLARPFPQAVDGQLKTVAYDVATRTLEVTIDPARRKLQHRFSVPGRTYPGGVRVTCDGTEIPATPSRGRVWITCDGAEIVLAPR